MPNGEACWPWCLSFPSLWNGWDKKGPFFVGRVRRMESRTKEPWQKYKCKHDWPPFSWRSPEPPPTFLPGALRHLSWPQCSGRDPAAPVKTAKSRMHLTEPPAQRAKVQAHPLPHSRSVKRHINKQRSDSGKNFQKDEKLIRCVRSLTFRSHVGKQRTLT